MSRIALLCSEPLRERMAGIGIRYLELSRRLPAAGIDTVIVSAGEPGEVPGTPAEIRTFERGRLAEILSDCDGAVAQGQLANDLVLECPSLPTAIDLYDPWLVENLHYTSSLGLDPWRNDHATWNLQLARGDLFLCSSDEQRLFYLGFLTALGRINPENIADDPDLDRLARVVPFGVPDSLPAHQPLLAPRREGEVRLLFGGIYDWYDPHTLLDALARLEELPWSLVFVRNPNPGATPQRLLGEAEHFCRKRGWWGQRVQLIDWVAAERRFDLLRDADLLVAPHHQSLETRLSLRTRFLDAFALGVPVVVSSGGAIASLVAAGGAGWVAPPGDAQALAGVLRHALSDPPARRAAGSAGLELARRFSWDQVLAPLLDFCRTPWRDSSKERFGSRLPTSAPRDPLGFRVRRKLRRWMAQ
jgi:glycosyltransferase involved in cell wall biosynthesis